MQSQRSGSDIPTGIDRDAENLQRRRSSGVVETKSMAEG